jgi:hypothetical protein
MKLKFQNELDGFAETVKQFCSWIEEEFTEPLEELRTAEKYLTELHYGVLKLPETSTIWNEVEDLEEFKNTFGELKNDWAKCRAKFENLPINGYWEIFDASEIENQIPVFAELSDDLADVYSDLKAGLLLYEKEMFPEAFWEWRFRFQIHWGNHLTGAQKAIRNYISFKTEL